MTARARLVAVVLAAAEPRELAQFWAVALRWTARDAAAGAVELVPADATGFHLLLRPATLEKLGQNRIHVDLTTASPDDQRETVDRLLALGATRADVGQGSDEPHVVLADPEGNELCIIEPTNRFLAGCPRLGALNCDGTRALGQFYSRALEWPLVWDQDEETAVQTPGGTGPKVTWSGPPLMPRRGVERLHLHLAPAPGSTAADTLDRLLALGATRTETGGAGHDCPGAIALADVDGNAICLVEIGGSTAD